MNDCGASFTPKTLKTRFDPFPLLEWIELVFVPFPCRKTTVLVPPLCVLNIRVRVLPLYRSGGDKIQNRISDLTLSRGHTVVRLMHNFRSTWNSYVVQKALPLICHLQ